MITNYDNDYQITYVLLDVRNKADFVLQCVFMLDIYNINGQNHTQQVEKFGRLAQLVRAWC
jgi:hypothetical protein